jgi:hypothetical protein
MTPRYFLLIVKERTTQALKRKLSKKQRNMLKTIHTLQHLPAKAKSNSRKPLIQINNKFNRKIMHKQIKRIKRFKSQVSSNYHSRQGKYVSK